MRYGCWSRRNLHVNMSDGRTCLRILRWDMTTGTTDEGEFEEKKILVEERREKGRERQHGGERAEPTPQDRTWSQGAPDERHIHPLEATALRESNAQIRREGDPKTLNWSREHHCIIPAMHDRFRRGRSLHRKREFPEAKNTAPNTTTPRGRERNEGWW